MELKKYQRTVIDDLIRYLELLNETKDYPLSFQRFWIEKRASSLGFYQDILHGFTCLGFQVPTVPAKTFLACNAIQPIFEAMPCDRCKVVVWLVPSETILTQTLNHLKDTSHPYRQKLDVCFGSRVEVYSKEELLNGQNFNPTAVAEQVSIMVLSYDSFRRSRKDVLKAYQENSNLADFARVLGKPEFPIGEQDEVAETALFQIINQLAPLVIVDESHHARSQLSLDMLRNFNPSFVLELTATPRKESNVISYVDAIALKRENMVKLPVVVYNRHDRTEVIADTIDLRNKLEELALAERQRTGRYIRPIALFQAQPKGKEDAATFDRLKAGLVEAGIPAEQIAIRTANVNQLKGVKLESPDCPIRYIITVNALKEGWDCPFAYILASLANKTSRVDVEQVLGRVLRLPYTAAHGQSALNMSYVLTSSNDFSTTVNDIVQGLNNAGFSKEDVRVGEFVSPALTQGQLDYSALAEEDSEDTVIDGSAIGQELQRRREQQRTGAAASVDSMLAAAERMGSEYQQNVDNIFTSNNGEIPPFEARQKMNTSFVKPDFERDIEEIQIPQFFLAKPKRPSLFDEPALLDEENLAVDFSLVGKSYEIDFDAVNDNIFEVDVRENEGGVPRSFKAKDSIREEMRRYLQSQPSEVRRRQSKQTILDILRKFNSIADDDLLAYIELIVGSMTSDQLAMLENSPMGVAEKIKDKIKKLLVEHYKRTFHLWIETNQIECSPSYSLPRFIHLNTPFKDVGRSLYQAEEKMNGMELQLVMELSGIENVRWWHRNVERRDFAINGFINHYPDVIVMTQSGVLVLIETKGGHLRNDDSRNKIEMGRIWQNKAGDKFRYYMVFADNVEPLEGGKTMKDVLKILREL